MTSVGPLHTPSLTFKHLPPRRKDVVNLAWSLGPLLNLQIGSSGKALTTAYFKHTIGFITSMDPHVWLQIVTTPKNGLPLYPLSKVFTIRVDPLVSFHGPSMAESLTAHITNKGFKTCVDNLVFLQIASPDKGLVTYITNKGFVTNVDQLVCFQALRVD